MALLRQWRGFRRRCHRSLLSALRSDTLASPGDADSEHIHSSDRAQPWLGALYGSIVASKRSREMAQAVRISSPSVPVISVGNFTFGATGKTPCVMALTKIALRHSRDRASSRVPMLLTRGYGDDEWRLFKSAFPECKLVIGSDRVHVGTEKAREYGAELLSCVVLDDGLQQWRIRKDLEVVMVDALHPFGNGLLIPHGSLRERPRDALARADIVVIHHANLLRSQQSLDALKQALLLACTSAAGKPTLATSQMKVKRLVRARDMRNADSNAEDADADASANEELQGKVALIVCGVGNPESVKLVVQAMGGWHQVEMDAFPDHHMFTNADLQDMERLAAQMSATTQREVVVVTTEKDFFRAEQLMGELAQSCDLRVLQCELELIDNAQSVRDRVLEVLDRRGEGNGE